MLTQAHLPEGFRLNYQPSLQAVKVDLNTAIPLSLILNELILNAAKYAYEIARKGCCASSFVLAQISTNSSSPTTAPAFRKASIPPPQRRSASGLSATDLSEELAEQGFDVAGIADCADAAIATCQAIRPDLVLMDIQLHGSAAAEAIHKTGVPIIFLTAHYDRRTIKRAKAAHPVGYLTKPFNSTSLSRSASTSIAPNPSS